MEHGIGAEKLLRLANRAKHVQRASKILKQRINNSKMNLPKFGKSGSNDLGAIEEGKGESGGDTGVRFKKGGLSSKLAGKDLGDMFPKIK